MVWCIYFGAFFYFLGQAQGAPATSNSVMIGPGQLVYQGSTAEDGIVQYLGMPYAAPPVGNLRFQPPQPPAPKSGTQAADSYGAACPQQIVAPVQGIQLLPAANNSSEDCLFINVITPSNVPTGELLPVIFWIHDGGFTDGDSSQHPGNPVVQRSIALGQPVIYVSHNFRLNALGFLGGAEVMAAGIGNLGIQDQRLALQWVHDNIANFGGDPAKVTLWGQGSGASSVGIHLTLNEGNPGGLYRAAFMQSGSPPALRNITTLQPFYDQLVKNTGCASECDTLGCLRNVSIDKLMDAVNLSPSIASHTSLASAWVPALDGDFIATNPLWALDKGTYAKVPYVVGDCDDEGTLFSLATQDITKDPEFLDYMNHTYFPSPGISGHTLKALAKLYPNDTSAGSPFKTGNANGVTPEFKRLAAVQGDLMFHAPRRHYLQVTSRTQPAYSYLYKRGKQTPLIGSVFGSDIPEFYGTSQNASFVGTDALINFASNLNPNTNDSLSLLSKIVWNEWSSNKTAPPLLTFNDPAPNITITADTFRSAQLKLMTQLTMEINS